jgi:hypothetical protein
LALACSAANFAMPPRMPPVPKSGGRVGSALVAGRNCASGLEKAAGGDPRAQDGVIWGAKESGDRKIGGCQAMAPTRLAGICAQ